ncbi:hypothetical protein SUGI_0722220 [Cryptomeria japonica]|nr:hypothetical protein SUGI_0722220 [Cryptomeria japonica]
MAVNLYTLFFPEPSSSKHGLPGVVAHDHHSLKRNLDQLIPPSEEQIKRRRKNQNIVLCERMRRQKMTHLFSILRSLLPVSTTHQAPRYCITEEAVKYIQALQNKTQELQKKKAHLLATRGSLIDQNSSAIDRESISLNVCIDVYSSETVVIRITASRMPRFLCKIYEEVEAHALEIQSADVYKGETFVFLYINATVIVSNHYQNSLQLGQIVPRLKETLQNIF